MLRTILPLSAILSLLLASSAVHAGKPAAKSQLPQPYDNKPIADGATVWYCAYSGNALIRCQLEHAEFRHAAPAVARDHHMPAVARQIIEAPEDFAGLTIEIPLHAPPFEFALAGQLAESVMCGGRKTCAILFGESPAQLARLVRQREAGRLARRAATVLAANSPVH